MPAVDDLEIGHEADRIEPSVHATDYLWRPLKIKILWLCSFGYWAGVLVSQAKPELLPLYQTVVGGYLTIFLFPPIVLMVLGAILLRAKLNAGEWEITPISRPYGLMYGDPGYLGDPLNDPNNPRSGYSSKHHDLAQQRVH